MCDVVEAPTTSADQPEKKSGVKMSDSLFHGPQKSNIMQGLSPNR